VTKGTNNTLSHAKSFHEKADFTCTVTAFIRWEEKAVISGLPWLPYLFNLPAGEGYVESPGYREGEVKPIKCTVIFDSYIWRPLGAALGLC
jgi:hypothetical protein